LGVDKIKKSSNSECGAPSPEPLAFYKKNPVINMFLEKFNSWIIALRMSHMHDGASASLAVLWKVFPITKQLWVRQRNNSSSPLPMLLPQHVSIIDHHQAADSGVLSQAVCLTAIAVSWISNHVNHYRGNHNS
jgi:hypothetical protein